MTTRPYLDERDPLPPREWQPASHAWARRAAIDATKAAVTKARDARRDPQRNRGVAVTEAVTYTEDDADKIAEVLLGHRIVQAEIGSFAYPGSRSWGSAEGRLILDDGTTVYLKGNDGGCSCSAGDYPLEKVATVDNVITSVRVECSPDDDYASDGEGAYRIFVFADAAEINAAEFLGSDGNGYYGTGFSFTVVSAEVTR